jgi:hypothetical protein
VRLSVRKYLVLCYARDCYRLGPWMQEVVGFSEYQASDGSKRMLRKMMCWRNPSPA